VPIKKTPPSAPAKSKAKAKSNLKAKVKPKTKVKPKVTLSSKGKRLQTDEAIPAIDSAINAAIDPVLDFVPSIVPESATQPESNASEKSAPPEVTVPVFPLRDMVLLPGTTTPLILGRPTSLQALGIAQASPVPLGLFTLQVQADTENPGPGDMRPGGVVGRIVNGVGLPMGSCRVLGEAR
jgi:hypothetical protein